MMFSKFSSVLHQAVEALSAGAAPHQEFTGHWKAITSYFIENKEQHRVCIEHTEIPYHLDRMYEKLQNEDGPDKTGPCLEYVLQHKILETLATLARTDTPPGMKQEVLLLFTKLLSRIQHPLLPHMQVHKPVQRLVRLCGEQRAGPTEAEEIHFLCTLSAKLKAQPYLVNFFIDLPGLTRDVLSNGVSDDTITQQPGTPTRSQPVFPLVNALLSLMHSPDARVAVKSCEGLMLICSLPEPSCSQAILKHTQISSHLTQQMSSLYRRIPKVLNPHDIESSHAKWGLDVNTSRENDMNFSGRQQLLALLSWLDYCDELVAMASAEVARNIATFIKQNFLLSEMKNSIIQTSESGAITATSILTRCLYCVHSKQLVTEFSQFILGVHENENGDSSSILPHLLERCNHLSDELSITTLKLFDTLLLKSDSYIFEKLVLNYLLPRTYKKIEVPPPQESTELKDGKTTLEEKEDDNLLSEDPNDDLPQQKDEEGGEGDGLSNTSPQHTEETAVNIHKTVNSFLSLVPPDAKSSAEVGDTGYDTYLRDAHTQYSDSCMMCKSFDWPRGLDSNVPVNFTFKEGEFLKMLFDRMLKALDQSYEVNLQLTSVLSKLCLLPHPVLQEYLLEPTLALRPDSRNLFAVLQKICNDIQKRIQPVSNVKSKLLSVRRQLTAFNSNLKGVEDGQLLAGIIVIEEFCKELAAIAFVKHHTL